MFSKMAAVADEGVTGGETVAIPEMKLSETVAEAVPRELEMALGDVVGPVLRELPDSIALGPVLGGTREGRMPDLVDGPNAGPDGKSVRLLTQSCEGGGVAMPASAPRAGVEVAVPVIAAAPVESTTFEEVVLAGGDASTGEVPVSGADLVPPSAPQERRRASHESITFHRAADGPLLAERQVVAAITASASGRTEILLYPQDLGRVRLSLEGDESALVLTIQAERSETVELLRRNADMLVQEFREAGYENLTFSFSDQNWPDGEPWHDDDAAGPAPVPVEILAELAPRPGGTGTLDLRL